MPKENVQTVDNGIKAQADREGLSTRIIFAKANSIFNFKTVFANRGIVFYERDGPEQPDRQLHL